MKIEWEYKAVVQVISGSSESDSQRVEETLNKLGSEGWELTGIYPRNYFGGTFFFKRVKEAQS